MVCTYVVYCSHVKLILQSFNGPSIQCEFKVRKTTIYIYIYKYLDLKLSKSRSGAKKPFLLIKKNSCQKVKFRTKVDK